MHLQFAEHQMNLEDMFFLSDFEDLIEGGFEKRRKSTKFKQDRNFPSHKKGRQYRRKKTEH